MRSIWTTQEVAQSEQFSYWRDAISSTYVPLESENILPRGFAGRLDVIGHQELRASTIQADGHQVRLTRSGIARQRSNPFFVNLLRSGHAEVSQNGEFQSASPGDVYILDTSAPWSVTFRTPFDMVCVEIDESQLRPRLGARGRMTTPVLVGPSGRGSLLARYLAMIGSLQPEDVGDDQILVAEHCTALLARANARSNGTAPSLRDQRNTLNAILVFIDSHMTDTTLSPAKVSQALRISRSYLYKVLAGGGHTFNGYLRGARLNACHAALRRHPDRSISQVAASWGFNTTSSFNRAYLRQFGEVPSRVRRQED